VDPRRLSPLPGTKISIIASPGFSRSFIARSSLCSQSTVEVRLEPAYSATRESGSRPDHWHGIPANVDRGSQTKRLWLRACNADHSIAPRGILTTVTEPVIVADVRSAGFRSTEQPAYDRPFELQALYTDPRTGAEHYVVRYQAGTRAKWHRHSAAHTIIVVAGRMVANGQPLGAGGYAHFPGGAAMLHEPAAGQDCTFVLIFDGPFDLEVLEGAPG
jgi:quercetin dioxygenase-like cupin family protein